MSETTNSTEHKAGSQEQIITDESIYEELLIRSGGKLSGDGKAIKEFEPIYRKLHTLGTQLGDAYFAVAHQFGYDPGKVEVVLGGGRAKGNPFKDDSDLDIFFYVENPAEGLEAIPLGGYPHNPIDAMDEKILKMQKLLGRVTDICVAEHVDNKFHIMGFGSAIPEKYSENKELLLAKSEIVK